MIPSTFCSDEPKLILVSRPIDSLAFAVGHLADFQGANDEHICIDT
jgi:hypothetical protein